MGFSYVSIAEAAKRLGLSPRRVLVLIASGRIRSDRFGAAWAISPRELSRFAGMPRAAGRPRKAKCDG